MPAACSARWNTIPRRPIPPRYRLQLQTRRLDRREGGSQINGMALQPPSDYGFSLKVPEGDDRTRHVCDDCGWIHYINPKIVVGAVCVWNERILLCRRAIE